MCTCTRVFEKSWYHFGGTIWRKAVVTRVGKKPAFFLTMRLSNAGWTLPAFLGCSWHLWLWVWVSFLFPLTSLTLADQPTGVHEEMFHVCSIRQKQVGSSFLKWNMWASLKMVASLHPQWDPLLGRAAPQTSSPKTGGPWWPSECGIDCKGSGDLTSPSNTVLVSKQWVNCFWGRVVFSGPQSWERAWGWASRLQSEKKMLSKIIKCYRVQARTARHTTGQ